MIYSFNPTIVFHVELEPNSVYNNFVSCTDVEIINSINVRFALNTYPDNYMALCTLSDITTSWSFSCL
jgi:hypothetical protein